MPKIPKMKRHLLCYSGSWMKIHPISMRKSNISQARRRKAKAKCSLSLRIKKRKARNSLRPGSLLPTWKYLKVSPWKTIRSKTTSMKENKWRVYPKVKANRSSYPKA